FSTKRLGGLVAIGWLLAALPGCADNQVTDCTSRSCDGFRPLADVSVTKHSGRTCEDAPAVDAGPSRSALCGTIGCFPGFSNACGVNPTGDSGFYFPFAEAGDAQVTDGADSSSSDVFTDANAEAYA